VGDRGMLTDTQIKDLKQHPGLGWVSALRASAIRKLADTGALQLSLFDEQNLAEIRSPAYPGERLMACYNPLLAEQRSRCREELLVATEKELRKLARRVERRTKKPLGKKEIALAAGKFINQFKVAKHFRLTIEDGNFAWSRDQVSIDRETQLDGIYVIRTSEPEKRFSAEDGVRNYKRLTNVEQAFRSLKSQHVLASAASHSFQQVTEMNPLQAEAFELLDP